MDLIVLQALHSTIPREQLCEAYEAATGEQINLELVDQLIKTKKKQSILTIEKELLSSYVEAVSDMKKIRTLANNIPFTSENDDKIAELINKHVDRIKSSGIWD